MAKNHLTNNSIGVIIKIIQEGREAFTMLTKDQMIDDVIRKYGFENKWVVWFCELAEVLTENQLLNAYILLDANILSDVLDE